MRNFIAFVFVSFVVSGCFSSHGRPDFVVPMEDSGPFVGGDAGPTEPDSGRAELDAGPTEPDLGSIEVDAGPVIEEDAGSDAFVPMEDAGSDAGTIIEPDAGTPVEVGLAISLASTPTSSIAVKKQLLIRTAGLTLTALPGSNITVREMRISGVGDTGSSYFMSRDLSQVVVFCGLFNGDTQVGTLQAPDAVTGAMYIQRMGLTVPRGTSVELTVRCTADSVVSGVSGDRYAVGIQSSRDVIAEDESLNAVTAEISDAVMMNTGVLPRVIVTVLDHGELTIVPCDHPAGEMLVAGGGVNHFLAQYCVSARYEDGLIERGSIASLGDAASFERVTIAVDGVVRGSSVLPAGRHRSVDVDTSVDPILVPRDGTVRIQLWAALSDVVSSASAGGATSGVARSGVTISLGLNAGNTSGEWDSSYVGHYNLRMTGTVSGDRLFADGATNLGRTFVVRRTRPVVSLLPSSTGLVVGTNSLGTLRVSADPAGTLGLRRYVLYLISRADLADRFTLSNFWLMRNGYPVPSEDVIITDDQGRDLESSSWTTGPVVGHYVSVDVVHEDLISGSGYTYTVYAEGSGTLYSGDLLSVQALDGSQPYTTGYISGSSALIENPGTITGDTFIGPHLDIGGPRSAPDTTLMWGLFLWSDLSEEPLHSDATRVLGGSCDWMNGGMVPGLGGITSIFAR